MSDESENESSSSEEEEEKVSRTRSSRRAAPRKSFKEPSSEEESDEEDDESESDSDSPPSRKRRKPAAAASKSRKAPSKVKSPSTTKRIRTTTTTTTAKPHKAPTHLKQLEAAMKAVKWWEAEPLPEGTKWRSLEHNGVQFPPPYIPHKALFLYDGVPFELNHEAEEMATYYAACLGSQQLETPSTAKTFNANFFGQFQGAVNDAKVKEFAKCDFTHIRAHLDAERDRKKDMSREEKLKKKEEAEKTSLKYMFAVVDGTLTKVANSVIEPPGLFRGRGEHPKAGLLKPRIIPENVTLNIGEGAPIPVCPIPGHNWGRIVHNHTTTWLANWKDMNGSNKYVYLSASSHFKGQVDRDKYDKARRLKTMIPQIRANYMAGMQSGESTSTQRQIACAMWIIDRLALRVGGEKDEDEADTVGTCSLRVEHIQLTEPFTMTLDFLGKDSMRHFETYNLDDAKYEGSGVLAFKCLKSFVADKNPEEQILDSVVPQSLNEHLKGIMPGLTAKVFRTYNASFTLEKELPLKVSALATLKEKEAMYNDANRKVAILCNHQKSVSKSTELGFEKKMADIAELESQVADLSKWMKKPSLAVAKEEDEEDDPAQKRAKSHMFSSEPSKSQIEKRLQVWEKKLETLKHKTSEADKNKSVALNTSKINYMDPRISVAWAKRNEFPIEKIYSATQRDKFPWAMSETVDFKF